MRFLEHLSDWGLFIWQGEPMIAKCTKCHHEWRVVGTPGVCGWCGAPGEKLADDYMEGDTLGTIMNRMLDGFFEDGVLVEPNTEEG
jgi:hypothetical protein